MLDVHDMNVAFIYKFTGMHSTCMLDLYDVDVVFIFKFPGMHVTKCQFLLNYLKH